MIDMERFKRKQPVLHKGAEVMMFIFTYAGENNLRIESSYSNMQTDQLIGVANLIEQRDFRKLNQLYGMNFIKYLFQYFLSAEDYENCHRLKCQIEF